MGQSATKFRMTVVQGDGPFSSAERESLVQMVAEEVAAHDRTATASSNESVPPGELASLDPTVVEISIHIANAGVITAVVHGLFQCIARWQRAKGAPIKVKLGDAMVEFPGGASEDRLKAIIDAVTSSQKPSPAIIRDVIFRLTGTACKGIVSEEIRNGNAVYHVEDGTTIYLCTVEKDKWAVVVEDGTETLVWTEAPDASVKSSLQMIKLLIEPAIGPLNPQFCKTLWHHDKNIQRKWFSTDKGPLILHTRPHPLGSEAICEMRNEQLFVHYIWERATGGVDPTKIKRINSLTF